MPMATIWIDGFRPDLVCSVRQETCSMVAGFEVKADIADWPKGLTQARVYRNGVHRGCQDFGLDRRGWLADAQRGNDRGFASRRRVPPREPACEAIAAVARAVLLSQPAVHLVVETLRRAANGALGIPELLKAAMHRDEVLARALFLRNPDRDLNTPVAAIDFRTATVFQFKQILWHAGILASKAEVGAGGGANRYRPEDDRWSLDEHILRTPLAGVRRGAMGLPEPFRGT